MLKVQASWNISYNVLYLEGQMIDKGNYNSQKCDQLLHDEL